MASPFSPSSAGRCSTNTPGAPSRSGTSVSARQSPRGCRARGPARASAPPRAPRSRRPPAAAWRTSPAAAPPPPAPPATPGSGGISAASSACSPAATSIACCVGRNASPPAHTTITPWGESSRPNSASSATLSATPSSSPGDSTMPSSGGSAGSGPGSTARQYTWSSTAQACCANAMSASMPISRHDGFARRSAAPSAPPPQPRCSTTAAGERGIFLRPALQGRRREAATGSPCGTPDPTLRPARGVGWRRLLAPK